MQIRVTLVFSPRVREVYEVELLLDAGATVAQALHDGGLAEKFPAVRADTLEFGVWGVKTTPNRVLQDLDRVEIYRPLKVDPKEARRARFVGQGARTAGLFVRQRPGAKSGY